MTTEIAVLNKEAVALAADSAVSSGGNQPKIYNSADKIFALSNYQPVGVMIYGTAKFMGIPWETVIKSYRADLKSKTFASLGEYADNFIEYLDKHTLMFTEKDEVLCFKQLLASRFRDLQKYIEMKIYQKAALKKAVLTPEETKELLRETLEGELKKWEQLPQLDTFQGDFVTECERAYDGTIREAVNSVFAGLDEPLKETLVTIAKHMLAKISPDPSDLTYSSGLVIAGFGENQFFPSLKSFFIEGKINKRVKRIVEQDISITQEENAMILPFAQQEMIITFMEGLSPNLKATISRAVSKLCKRLCDEVSKSIEGLNNVTDDERTRVGAALSDNNEKFRRTFEKLLEDSVKKGYGPIMEAVQVLPKDELASLAEALVYLTSVKRRVTMTPETVGGPIDVAVISKGDGLIWIKRKTYFKPELNPRFFETRYRESLDARKTE